MARIVDRELDPRIEQHPLTGRAERAQRIDHAGLELDDANPLEIRAREPARRHAATQADHECLPRLSRMEQPRNETQQ